MFHGKLCGWILVYSIGDSRSTKFIQMMIQGWPLIFLWQGQICIPTLLYSENIQKLFWGWSGGAKVLCILHHWGVQLILAYSWARPAILIVGKGRGGNVFISSVSSLSFLFLFLPCPSFISSTLSSISLLPFSGRRHKMILKGWRVVKPQHSQSIKSCFRIISRTNGL